MCCLAVIGPFAKYLSATGTSKGQDEWATTRLLEWEDAFHSLYQMLRQQVRACLTSCCLFCSPFPISFCKQNLFLVHACLDFCSSTFPPRVLVHLYIGCSCLCVLVCARILASNYSCTGVCLIHVKMGGNVTRGSVPGVCIFLLHRANFYCALHRWA